MKPFPSNGLCRLAGIKNDCYSLTLVVPILDSAILFVACYCLVCILLFIGTGISDGGGCGFVFRRIL